MKPASRRQSFQGIERCAEIFQHVAVGVLKLTGWTHQSDQRGQALDDQSKLAFNRELGCFRRPAILDIGIDAVPSGNFTHCVHRWRGTQQKPSILTIATPQTRFHLTRPAVRANRFPSGAKLGHIVRVDRAMPTRGVLEGEAGVFEPARVEEFDASVRVGRPDQSGQRVDDSAQIVIHVAPSATIATTRGCATRRVASTLPSLGASLPYHRSMAGSLGLWFHHARSLYLSIRSLA